MSKTLMSYMMTSKSSGTFHSFANSFLLDKEGGPGKYKHSCVAWYRKSHLAKMDGVDFDAPKPPKDWNERI